MPDDTAAPAPTPASLVADAGSTVLRFYGAHRESPFTPRKAIIIDEVESDNGVPATDDDPGRGPRRIVNVLVFNSAQHDGGRPEVEQVKNVLVLDADQPLKEGEETAWEWPAVNFVSTGAPTVTPRPTKAPAAKGPRKPKGEDPAKA